MDAKEQEQHAADAADRALVHALREVLSSQDGGARAHGVSEDAAQRHAHHVRRRGQAWG